ncbi:hypothetical protein BO94DRAFT_503713 [Aspergillus sclerotioniger CBS 115572]|uniref:BTB domain-containing protein n=1 Tax=Aspergillus sclerotioniger CBS 115572 TaxID=1450535 RepID=A0A317UZX5_9EURO|nr:hypothetical protein BO94DRAFT_503713 [Aspergillus sclerotioniger CBS 115572]PWY67613.1 hypothetical protein BO94DRAFT_503713 [Aspergillus sclerotioniger CBS 115572]
MENMYDKGEEEGDGMVVRFKASARHLSSSSPFFRALLLSGFSESIKFKAEGSVAVSTKQWDADAFLYVLKILHCKHHELPRQVDLDMVAKVCVVGDFYGCQDAVRFATQCWITKLKPVPNNKYRPLLLWLWITFFFRMPASFNEVTSIIITQGKGVIGTLGLPIPAPIMGAINNRRREAITDLVNHIHEEHERYTSGDLGCSFECGSMMAGGIDRNLKFYKLRPVDGFEAPYHNHSYMSVVRTIEMFTTPRWYDVTSTYSSYGYQYTAHQCHDSTYASLRDGWNGHLDGLELKDFVKLR